MYCGCKDRAIDIGGGRCGGALGIFSITGYGNHGRFGTLWVLD